MNTFLCNNRFMLGERIEWNFYGAPGDGILDHS